MFDRQTVEAMVDQLLEGKLKKADFMTELERMWPPEPKTDYKLDNG